MEEAKKFCSQTAISITTFFGGPLAAGILIRENYKTMDEEKKGNHALMIGIAATLFLFSGIFIMPENILDKMPQSLIPLVYTGIIFWIVEKTQGHVLKAHKENKGEFYSGWKSALIGVISLGIILFFIGLSAFIAGDLSKNQPDFDLEAYDKGIALFSKNEEVSVEVFNTLDTAGIDYLVKEMNKNIIRWQENKEIIKNINSIENLPEELTILNEKLDTYCNLRIEHFRLIVKALSENTDKYDNQMQFTQQRIEKIIEELK